MLVSVTCRLEDKSKLQGRIDGGISGPPKSRPSKLLWSKNDVTTVIELIPQ